MSFVEYYCQKCGDQLVICSDVRKARDRKKVKKTKKKRKKKSDPVNANQIGCLCCRLASVLQPTHLTKRRRLVTRVLLMVMEPPWVLLMMELPSTRRGRLLCRLAFELPTQL